MGCPSGVSDTGMGIENLGEVGLRFVDELLELGDLANLLECENLVLLVAIHCYTGRVVATILKTGEA